jgi:hypothetical protein
MLLPFCLTINCCLVLLQ